MSDTASYGVPPPPGQPGLPPPAPGPAPWPLAPQTALRRPTRWPTFAALGIALISLVVGAIGWFRPIPHNNHPAAPSAPIYTEQQASDAKANICAAYTLSKNEVAENTHRPNPAGSDETTYLAVAANGRLAIYTAGDYLLNRLAAEPATPADLAESVRSLANSYLEAAMRALNNAPDSALDAFRHEIDADISKIDGLCK